ncbi:30S ribosomal protein S20 [Limosilactobacillus fermentum]|nr:30S ribosomal protein S20 [Limosilactobacillus fermentum]
MPIIKSAIERAKTNVKANERNSAQLSTMRTAVKRFEKLRPLAPTMRKNYTRLLPQLTRPTSKGLIKA